MRGGAGRLPSLDWSGRAVALLMALLRIGKRLGAFFGVSCRPPGDIAPTSDRLLFFLGSFWLFGVVLFYSIFLFPPVAVCRSPAGSGCLAVAGGIVCQPGAVSQSVSQSTSLSILSVSVTLVDSLRLDNGMGKVSIEPSTYGGLSHAGKIRIALHTHHISCSTHHAALNMSGMVTLCPHVLPFGRMAASLHLHSRK